MAQKHPWSWFLAVPLVFVTGCTGGGSDSSEDTVRITLQARYEKRALTTNGFSSQLNTQPARYCWAEVWRSGDSSPLKYGNLGTDGTGWVDIPRGIAFKVVVRADITVPSTSGSNFFMHGSVKSGVLQTAYTNSSAFNQVPTWYMESLPQVADSDFTLPLLAREDPSSADGNAGPFAIADQMAAFAEKTRDLEPTVAMPDLHAFWNAGNTSTSYPRAAVDSAIQPKILVQPSTTLATDPVPGDSRPIYQHAVRYAGPNAVDRGADAYNDSLLQETFARFYFSCGLIRSDNDADAYISPNIPSESTIAFASGFGNFLSCAFRNSPYLYDIGTDGKITYWRVDQHQKPSGGGEFLASSIARAQWGIWKNASVFNGTPAGLATMWDATNPKIAKLAFEFGNAPLGCYPTYLVGLARLASTQAGSAAGNAIRAELALENMGNGYGDITVPGDPYYTTNPTNPLDNLWITQITLPLHLSGSLKTYNSTTNGLIAYDQDQAQTYRIYHDGNSRTITLTTSGPALRVELFDSLGYLAYALAPGSANTIPLTGKTAGYYAVRVSVDPQGIFTGTDASYTLTIQ